MFKGHKPKCKKKSLLGGKETAYNILSIGLASGLCLAISLYIGSEVDLRFKTTPYGVFGGIILGLASSITYMIREIHFNLKRFEDDSGKDEKALKRK